MPSEEPLKTEDFLRVEARRMKQKLDSKQEKDQMCHCWIWDEQTRDRPLNFKECSGQRFECPWKDIFSRASTQEFSCSTSWFWPYKILSGDIDWASSDFWPIELWDNKCFDLSGQVWVICHDCNRKRVPTPSHLNENLTGYNVLLFNTSEIIFFCPHDQGGYPRVCCFTSFLLDSQGHLGREPGALVVRHRCWVLQSTWLVVMVSWRWGGLIPSFFLGVLIDMTNSLFFFYSATASLVPPTAFYKNQIHWDNLGQHFFWI